MRDYFQIKTLSDCPGCRKANLMNKNYNGLSDIWTDIGGVIGTIINALFSGGRSPQQVANDEYASASYHLAIALNANHPANPGHHVYPMDINQAAAILRPGWDAGENGTQLAQRFISALRAIDQGVDVYTQTGQIPTQSSLFGGSGLMPLLILGGLAFAFLNSPSKKRRSNK